MTRITFLFLFIVIGVFNNSVVGKKFTKCGLTNTLMNLNSILRIEDRSFIGHWVCLIESESFKDTAKRTKKANGRQGLGLFQIRSRDWCTFDRNGGFCNVKCQNMLDEDISDDWICAKKIKDLNGGLRAWDGWKRSCKNRRYIPIPNC